MEKRHVEVRARLQSQTLQADCGSQEQGFKAKPCKQIVEVKSKVSKPNLASRLWKSRARLHNQTWQADCGSRSKAHKQTLQRDCGSETGQEKHMLQSWTIVSSKEDLDFEHGIRGFVYHFVFLGRLYPWYVQ